MMIENLTILNVIQFVLVIQIKHVVIEIEFRYTILRVSNSELSISCTYHLKTLIKSEMRQIIIFYRIK